MENENGFYSQTLSLTFLFHWNFISHLLFQPSELIFHYFNSKGCISADLRVNLKNSLSYPLRSIFHAWRLQNPWLMSLILESPEGMAPSKTQRQTVEQGNVGTGQKKKRSGRRKVKGKPFLRPLFFCPFRLSLAPLSAPGSPRMGERELSLKIFTGYPKGTEMQFVVTFYWKQLTLHGPP